MVLIDQQAEVGEMLELDRKRNYVVEAQDRLKQSELRPLLMLWLLCAGNEQSWCRYVAYVCPDINNAGR